MKKLLFATSFLFGLLFSTNVIAQSSCSPKDKKDSAKTACCASKSTSAKKVATTSGCSPSACRGANTKKEINLSEYKILEMASNKEIQLTIDLLRSEHYWHPQMIIQNSISQMMTFSIMAAGQLGQPSIIFEAPIDMNDHKNYYLMELIGHGHHSGQTGEIYKDLSPLTTAKQIVERIVVGVKEKRS